MYANISELNNFLCMYIHVNLFGHLLVLVLVCQVLPNTRHTTIIWMGCYIRNKLLLLLTPSNIFLILNLVTMVMLECTAQSIVWLPSAGEKDIPGVTDTTIPRRLGPKRASKIRKLFNLSKEDDVRQYVVRRPITKEGKLHFCKS